MPFATHKSLSGKGDFQNFEHLRRRLHQGGPLLDQFVATTRAVVDEARYGKYRPALFHGAARRHQGAAVHSCFHHECGAGQAADEPVSAREVHLQRWRAWGEF